METPLPFSLRQLQYAVAVADERHFRRAAERCHVSQPSLSAQLAELEGALGVRLFERDRRGVLPTRAGEELVARARRVLLEAADLAQAAAGLRDPLAGRLRVGILPTVSPYLLPAVVPALRARFPRLAVAWLEEKTETLVRELHAGTLDAAVVALEADLGDVAHATLAEDAFVLAAPRDHALGRVRGPARREELRGASVLLLDDGHCFREQALEFCRAARAQELAFRATSLATLVQMVRSGAGVTILPELGAWAEAARADLVLRPFAPPVPHRTLALAWRRTSPADEALREIAGCLRQAYPRAAPAGKRSTARRRRF